MKKLYGQEIFNKPTPTLKTKYQAIKKNNKSLKKKKYAKKILEFDFKKDPINFNIPEEKSSEEIVSLAMISSRYKIVLGT